MVKRLFILILLLNRRYSSGSESGGPKQTETSIIKRRVNSQGNFL